MTEDRLIRTDRMRFTKNSLSSNLAIAAIIFDVFYFLKIYQSDVGTFYYNYVIGISVIYNLVFMLAAFLASEGVKNYKKPYSWLLFALGAGQVLRIFILPLRAHSAVISSGGVEIAVMGNGQFLWVVACLTISAVCLMASAVVNLVKCTALEAHRKTLADSGVCV